MTFNEYQLLSQVTLIVPTYKRQQSLGHLISFYSNYPINIFICDGSPGPSWPLSTNFNPKYHKYIHQSDEPFHARLNTLASLVETPYCAWLCDDEFQLPSGLLRSIQLFESHPEASSIIGSTIGFKRKGSDIFASPVYEYVPYIFTDELSHRIEDFFLHYCPTTPYALTRSDAMVLATEIATSHSWASANLIEVIQAFIVLLAGTHIRHSHPQWLRSYDNPPIHTQWNRDLSVSDWMHSKSFQEEVALLDKKFSKLPSSLLDLKFSTSHLFRYALTCLNFSSSNSSIQRKLSLKPNKIYRRKFSVPLRNYQGLSIGASSDISQIYKAFNLA